ncbi:MAG: helix-turn-helix transcriptional regulator [Thermoplasmata archaeon]
MQDWQRRRKMQGLTQAELADLVGISRTALSHIERGKSQPSRSTQENLQRALNPLLNHIRFRCGEGAMSGAEILQSVSAERGLAYALTLDVPAWLLTRYQTPAVAWAYVLRLREWVDALTELGIREASEAERADLILLRGTAEIMDESTVVQGLRIASVKRVMEDCAELSGRHALDAARLFLAHPRERPSRFRLDPAAVVKVWEDVLWT